MASRSSQYAEEEPLSPVDPFYYEKYLTKQPQDHKMRYEYAQFLEQLGRVKEAIAQYKLAADGGHLLAMIRSKQVAIQQEERPPLPDQKEARRRKRKKRLILLLLLLLLLGLLYWLRERRLQETAAPDPVTPREELPVLVVENAITRDQETAGSPLKALTALIQPAPENTLSFLPSGQAAGCPCGLRDGLLELDYYPQTSQLGLTRAGKETLALFPVASGPPLPFAHSRVTRRVVNPNGGQAGFGTRGIELQDNYAIHGTYQPELVGQKNVTHGCLRMRNEDIESLYPYVALGTPFEVKDGAPPPPTYADGLPVLPGATTFASEETPGRVYSWHE